METDIVLFWFVVLSCISGLVVMTTRLRSAALGWVILYLAILLIAVLGWVLETNGLIYAAFGIWLLLVLLPAMLSKLYYRHSLQQQYSTARRIARIISWLHPADGWRQQPEIIRALELAQQGNLTAATDTLRRFQGTKSLIGLAAVTNLYRLTNQWEELLIYEKQNHALEKYPQLLPTLLRAHGETGDLRGLSELYDRNKARIARLVPVTSRDSCRLMLFAFCGRRESVERILAGSLAILPQSAQEFWLATADMASGESESAKRQLEQLFPTAEPAVRLAIERRLSRISLPLQPLDAFTQQIVEGTAREHSHDENFGARRSLFSKQSRATQLLIAFNVLAFFVEIRFGGAMNSETLYRLGALFPPDVRAGQWWRLVTSLFLHAGLLHLAMNMFALCVLGPFVEFALGFRRYLLVYLTAGVGSMGTVVMLASGPSSQQMTVGASGCIMGLVGATGALMLRGWLREKALYARRRLTAVLAIIAMQTVFDSLVPQVSMTGHLSGAIIGFLTTMLLRDRLRARTAN